MKKLIAILLLTVGLMGCMPDIKEMDTRAPELFNNAGFAIQGKLYADGFSNRIVYIIKRTETTCKTYKGILSGESPSRTLIESIKCIDDEPVVNTSTTCTGGSPAASSSIKYHTFYLDK